MKYERETSNLLRRLGVNNSYIGFRYTIYGVIRSVHEPDLLSYISKGLYVEIAVRYKTSVGCVERNIRTIINTIWLHGDRNLLNQVFGFELAQSRGTAPLLMRWLIMLYAIIMIEEVRALSQRPSVIYQLNTYRRFAMSYSSAIRSTPLASVIMHLPSSLPLTGQSKNASPAGSTW